jgi:hypothetical protein
VGAILPPRLSLVFFGVNWHRQTTISLPMLTWSWKMQHPIIQNFIFGTILWPLSHPRHRPPQLATSDADVINSKSGSTPIPPEPALAPPHQCAAAGSKALFGWGGKKFPPHFDH